MSEEDNENILKPVAYYHPPLECNSFGIFGNRFLDEFYLRFMYSPKYNASKYLNYKFFREIWPVDGFEDFEDMTLTKKMYDYEYIYDKITFGSCRIYDEATRLKHNHKRTVISLSFDENHSDKGELVKKILDEHDPYGIINLKYVCIDTFIRQYQGLPPFENDD